MEIGGDKKISRTLQRERHVPFLRKQPSWAPHAAVPMPAGGLWWRLRRGCHSGLNTSPRQRGHSAPHKVHVRAVFICHCRWRVKTGASRGVGDAWSEPKGFIPPSAPCVWAPPAWMFPSRPFSPWGPTQHDEYTPPITSAISMFVGRRNDDGPAMPQPWCRFKANLGVCGGCQIKTFIIIKGRQDRDITNYLCILILFLEDTVQGALCFLVYSSRGSLSLSCAPTR